MGRSFYHQNLIGPLTKKQMTKKRWNDRNREYKNEWNRKNRPRSSTEYMQKLKLENPIKYKKILKHNNEKQKKYRQTKEGKLKNSLYCKRYREKCKAEGRPVRGGVSKSSYNPVLEKIRRDKHKREKTSYWHANNLRKLIHGVFRRRSSMDFKQLKSKELLGCSFETARKHIESLFKPGMSWNNYGKWHMDHIIPCASFDLRCPVQQLACCYYKNLQPLWAFDNMSKGSQIL